MLEIPGSLETITIRLAQTRADIEAAQRLRYQVFYEECAAVPDQDMARDPIDRDGYDAFADHLIVTDRSDGEERIVGTYRLLRRENAEKYGKFYSSGEYDLSPLLTSGASVLELGR